MSRTHIPYWAGWLATALAVSVPVATAARDAEWREVRAPYFGEVLFDYYQQKYFTAVTHLTVSQHFERLAPHADEAELLRGGLYLSYGLHREAGEIFSRLIEAGAPPAVRDRAWFYLAKIRYQRGYGLEAEDALARVQGRLPGEQEDERQVLHAFLLMSHGRYAEAVERLTLINPRSEWAAYGRYNLGVALIKAGEMDRGAAVLTELGESSLKDEELRALKDKANVALGYTFLQNGEMDRARTQLERVRLSGLVSNKALLGMGWAHSAQEQHDRSLVLWSELKGRDVMDSAVQESLLAVPYAMGKLKAYAQSLRHYEEAIEIYHAEMDRLDRSVDAIRRGRLVEALLGQNPGDEMGWFWQLQKLPDSPESHYLAHLMASHEFQEALKNYRDLVFLRDNLKTWAASLGAYEDMLANRRQAFAERLPRVLGASRTLDEQRMARERERLTAELARIEAEDDELALVDTREKALLDRLRSTQARLDRAGEGAHAAESRDKLRLLSGLLRWDVASHFKTRAWEIKKALKEIDAALAESQQRRAALVSAQSEAPKSFEAFSTRIKAARGRIAQLDSGVRVALSEQGGYVQQLAVAELERQKQRLATYLTQARFAVAQIYDQSSRAGEQP
jgi:hypothetical protein